jgi:hypothetical protein
MTTRVSESNTARERSQPRPPVAFRGAPAPRWKVYGIAFVLALIPMLLWTLASPISSVPDEPSHFVRAGEVVRGQLFPAPWSRIPTQTQAIVPRYLAFTSAMTCFAYRPDIAAGCQAVLTGDPDTLTTTGTTAQANSPTFYAIVGLPSLVFSGKLALYAMRAVSALLCALMIGFVFMAVSQLRRPRWAYVAALTAVTPMLLFLAGSVNPNGVEASAAASLFATLALLFSRFSTRRLLIERLAIVLVSTILLTGTRTISLLWVILALAAALLLGRSNIIRRIVRQPLVWVAAVLCALVCAAELAYFLVPPTTPPLPPLSGNDTSPLVAFVTMIVNTFDFGLGWIGQFGWVDTPAPGITIIAWSSAATVLALIAVTVVRGRARWALVLLFAALVLVPAFSQAAIIRHSGYIWQGRYTLAIFMMLILAGGVAIASVADNAGALVRKLAVIGVCLLGLGQVAAFFITLKRYVVGADGNLALMLTHPSWQPPLGWVPLVVVFTLFTALVCTIVARIVLRAGTPALSAPEPSPREPATLS